MAKRGKSVKTKEADVLRGCLDLLSIKRVKHFRTNNMPAFDPQRGCYRTFHGTKGMPDIIAIIPTMSNDGVVGCFCGIECKSSDGKQSEDQKSQEKEIVESGAYYLLVHSVDELANDLTELLGV